MTTELKAKDFLMHYLKKEYIKRSKVLNNLVSHVERLHKDFILTNIERTKNLKIINELVKMLNTSYELRLDTIKGAKYNHKHDDSNFEIDDTLSVASVANVATVATTGMFDKVVKIDKITNLEKNLSDILKSQKNNLTEPTEKIKLLDILYELSFGVYKNELKKFCPNDFSNFDKKIQDLVCSKEKEEGQFNGIGCKTILDCVNILSNYINPVINLTSEDKQLFDMLNMSFVPLIIECKKKESKLQIKVLKQSNILDKHEQLLGNFYKVEINTPYCDEFKQIHVFGFFENDCVDSILRSSQLSNTYLYNKKYHFIDLSNGKIKLTKALQKLVSIPDDFKSLYIQNMSVGDLIGFDDVTFVNEMSIDNSFYQKYSSIGNFRNVFSDFIQASILVKFKIIKYLLLSVNSNNAGLLFSLTKESKSGSPVVADIIYKNLNLPLQLKLHKENISIKSEMDKLGTMDTDDIDMKKQIILNKNIPPKVKKLALEKLNEMKSGGSEYYKQLIYVKTIIDYPWIGENDSDMFTQYKNDREKWKEIMISTKSQLDNKVYGHTECKETIVELLAKWFTNPNSMGKSLALQGGPGIGKTMIAMELGKAIGIPFVKINLGGLEDGAVLTGFSSTYSSSTSGLIVKRMTEAGVPRCIMFFDELDKTASHHGHNEISDILIHVTDPTTNSQFNDKFFQDVTFPLNKVLFVFSFNNRDKIDPILLDRMEVIKVDSYSIEDKIQIVNNHLIKDVKQDIGMDDLNIKISDENIAYLVDTYTNEGGVRGIKRMLEKIISKLNKDRIFGVGIFEKNKNVKTIEITKELINGYLPKQAVNNRKIHESPEVGVVNGMYVLSSGNDGGILPILVYKNQLGKGGKFTLKITGNQKRVMLESIEFAFTVAINYVKPNFSDAFFKNYPSGLHVHNPDASPKDGNSGGGATTLAFISKILNKKIKHNVALTGEIDHNGNIGEIGGLDGKLVGSKKAGVKLCFVPKDNEKDIEKIKIAHKSLFDDNFKVIIVKNIKEILTYALLEDCEYDHDVTYEKTFDCDKYLVNKCSDLQLANIFMESSDSESASGSDCDKSECSECSECSESSSNDDE